MSETNLQTDATAAADDTSPTADDAARRGRVIAAFSDWLHLLDGPRNRAFSDLVVGEDWGRLFRLLIFVLILSGTILGTRLTLEALYKDGAVSVMESQSAITYLIVGAMLSIAYAGVARLFGIDISVPKSFFLILSLGLPWVPIVTCIDVIPSLPQFRLIGVVFLLSHLVLIKPVVNFYRGVRAVSGCAGWRALTSVVAPILLFTFLILYMFGD